MRRLIFSLIAIFSIGVNVLWAQSNQSDWNCFSILVGKKATIDGAVLLAHNEDDYGATLNNCYKVPPIKHESGEKIILKRGTQISQVPQTNGFLWLEMPGYEFSDSYMNQWGVTIASNQCMSKEDQGETVNGGIGYYLRRIMAERAKTAREAVKIGGKLIEQLGYASTGRTYCIADPNEAWMLAAVKGKHWVAERIPDDQVAIIPNYYTIQEINLKDTLNFLGSPDIVEYAIKRGWYDPNSGKPFNFRLAYGSCVSLNHISNVARHWAAINLLANKTYPYDARLPFAFKPKSKVSIEDLMTVLRNHYEGTQLESNPAYNHGNPHKNIIMRICSQTNRYGFVAQLRAWLPADIGNLWWIAPRRPCIQPFVPWYSGINHIPAAYTSGDYQTALKMHFEKGTMQKEYTPKHAFWTFEHYADKIDSVYGHAIQTIRKQKATFQKEVFSEQKLLEQKALKMYRTNPDKARQMLTDFTIKYAKQALRQSEMNINKPVE